MKVNAVMVQDYMRISPVFVYENDTLASVMDVMKRFKLDSIPVIKEDFSIIGSIDKSIIKEILKKVFNNNIGMLQNTKIVSIIKKYDCPIVLYPRTTIENAFYTMKYFNIKCIPIVDVPWEKRIIGFLWFDDILSSIEPDFLKIPV